MSDYSDIQAELDDFKNAVYGEEVRDSMISAIKKIHDIAFTCGELVKARYIFPPNWEDTLSGSTAIIITPNNKTMMIDAHNDSASPLLLSWARAYISHIDVFVLTHYHPDHYGGISALRTAGLLDTSSKVYLPANTARVEADYAQVRSDIITALGSVPYEVATVGKVVMTDGEFRATLLNCSASMTYEDYNNQSTCILCQMGQQKALITGDAFSDPLYDIKGSVGKIELMTMGHHSINAGSSTKMAIALESYSPSYAIQPSTMIGSTGNLYHNSQQSAILQSIGTEIYPVHINTEPIEFDASVQATWVVSGVPVASVSSQRTKTMVYIDGSVDADAVQDGTTEHPYKSVQQAVGSCDFHASAEYELRIKSGTYGREHATTGKNMIALFNAVITFMPDSDTDTVILYNGFAIMDSHVRIRGIELRTETQAEGLITVRGSRLSLEGVTIDCSGGFSSGSDEGEETISDFIGVYAYRQSNLFINTCTIKNAARGVALNASTCHALNVTFDICTKAWSVATASILYEYGSVYTNVTEEKYVKPGSHDYSDLNNGGSGDGLTPAQKSTLIAVINAIGAFNVPNGQELIDAFNSAWQETGSIRLSPTSGTVTVGSTVNVSAITTGEGTLTATSSNPSVATVSVSGSTLTVRGVASGTAVITASFGGASATYTATVSTQSIPATGITLNMDTISFNSAQTVILSATVTPSNTTDTVTWSTSNTNVATVDGGAVVPVGNGSCTITATAGSVSATCAVTVNISSGTTVPMTFFQEVTAPISGYYTSDDTSTPLSQSKSPDNPALSVETFASDTAVSITIDVTSAQIYDYYLIGSYDGTNMLRCSNVIGTQAWEQGAHTYTETYTVLAGCQLAIAKFNFTNVSGNVTLTVTQA